MTMLFAITALLASTRTVATENQRTTTREQAFTARCGNCHTVDKLVPPLARRSASTRAAYLERFLPRHYAPDPVERKEIVQLLLDSVDRK